MNHFAPKSDHAQSRVVANPLGRHAAEGGCPACGSGALRPVMTLPSVPANSCLMLDSAEEARAYPRGAIELVFCEDCGFVHNRAFDAKLTEYSDRYEPTQAYSGTFQRFHKDLAARIAAKLGMAGGTAVEVGCGQGEFLHLLCRLADMRGIGFDPCLSAERADVVTDRAADVQLIGDFFSEASAEGLTADLLLSKMTLEHIPAAGRFAEVAARVARASRPGMRLFIQVPDCERIFRDGAFEDVYYEHCNYFTAASLTALFARHGFAVEEISREYGDQYLAIQARYTGEAKGRIEPQELRRVRDQVEHFSELWAAKVAEWQRVVAARRDRGVVLWGSGSKGVSFLSAVGGEGVSHVVDINPHRQGHYMVGSGHPIIGPAMLREIRPGCVIVMNPVYREEVAAMLAQLGVETELLAL